jgi:DNA-binding transcriptional LysR family regulator
MTDLEIKYFMEIVDQGVNFTRASQTLFVAQTALTKHINALNRELGVKLFDTSDKRHVSLTPAGRLYYQLFSDFRDKFKKTGDEARALMAAESGELRIAWLTGWDMEACFDQRNTFLKTFPNISFSVYPDSFKGLKNGLLNNKYDLVVTLSEQFQGIPNISIHDHFQVPCILLFASRHPLAGKENLSIRDFRDEPFYVITGEECPAPRLAAEAYCKSLGFIPRFEAYSTLEQIVLAAQTGVGCTIMDQWLREKNSHLFRYIPLDVSMTVSEVWKTGNTNRALRLFLETCGLVQ